MYVCALDRPWLSTPFPFQGFVIRGEKDIVALKQYCNYVYIDIMRGLPPPPDAGLQRSWRKNEQKRFEPPNPTRPAPGTSEKPEHVRRDYSESSVQGHARALAKPSSRITSVPLVVRHDSYRPPKQLAKELRTANNIHQDLTRSVAEVFDDVKLGRGMAANKVRQSTEKMVDSIIRHPDALIWLSRLKDKDNYAFAHSIRSSIFAVSVGRHMGLTERRLQTLAMGSMLCEIGKARLPRSLLEKSEKLTEPDIEKIQSHVSMGVELLGKCPGLDDDVIEVVSAHHERHDGTGYPNGLAGDQIPMLGRIAGMIDAYDAMTNVKPYTNRVYSTAEAIDYLYGERDTLFQGQLVEEFIQSVGMYPTGTLVELNTGEVGLVLSQDFEHRLQPEILVVLDRNKQQLDPPKKYNLSEINSKRNVPVTVSRALSPDAHGLNSAALLHAHMTSRWDWKKLAFRR